MLEYRSGLGYDVHTFAEGRPLILGGIEIPHHQGLMGHSDADVLIHAIIDAILGAAAMGDIGQHFPDTSKDWEGADSKILLKDVAAKVAARGFSIVNIDSTLVAQKPKLMEHIPLMRKTMSDILSISIDRVSVKATTSEKMGFVGREEGMACFATCMLSCSSH